MNDEQKRLLLEHMTQFENESFDQHALWATVQFGIIVNARQCSSLYIDDLFADRSNTLRFVITA